MTKLPPKSIKLCHSFMLFTNVKTHFLHPTIYTKKNKQTDHPQQSV